MAENSVLTIISLIMEFFGQIKMAEYSCLTIIIPKRNFRPNKIVQKFRFELIMLKTEFLDNFIWLKIRFWSL